MTVQKSILHLVLACFVAACGNDSVSFEGTWSGSFTTYTNSCPFSVVEDVNPLFPMTVSVDANDVYTVVAVTGETATGGQGQGQSSGFLALSDRFGRYRSTAPYTCETIVSEVGFLDSGDNKADVTLTIKFNNCKSPGTGDRLTTCGATYYGDAVR